MTVSPVKRANAPPPPRPQLSVAVTGHRDDNPTFAAHRVAIEAALHDILGCVHAAANAAAAGNLAPTRLHCLLAGGTDQLAATRALALGWELVAPLPFGLALNVAINAHPSSVDEARALLADPTTGLDACGAATGDRARAIHALAGQARLFELADQDAALSALLLETLQRPGDSRLAARFAAEASARVALAARVMIEQSDLLIAVWDGAARTLVGGTGYTVQAALDAGAPVIWVDASAPESWRILAGPEALAGLTATSHAAANVEQRRAELQSLVRRALSPPDPPRRAGHGGRGSGRGADSLALEPLHRHSHPLSHAYRRIEALFGADTFAGRFASLRQSYERPESIATGSAAELLAQARSLDGEDRARLTKIETAVLQRFVWADGVSARLSDVYRSGMTANFLLASLAIIGGVAYLPLTDSHHKWPFALFELALLVAVLAITAAGQKRRWHGRWLGTRRIAEYLRHAPIMLMFGVARAPGRWPKGTDTSWPEWYARQAIRELGLPQCAITQSYLRQALGGPLRSHVIRQRDYHVAKARRLTAVHRNLDRLADTLFVLAVISVASYLALKAGGALHWWSDSLAATWSYQFTLLGVLLPTLGSALAGIRYFGDFERFAAISRVTAERLQEIHEHMSQMLEAPEGRLDFGRAADLAHATDDVVVSEIESWQAVFGGKRVVVPV
jgi:hypothetical protein